VQILFIAPEGSPFVKTGGLADVIGSLPGALARQGLPVSVLLPDYGDIPRDYKEQMQEIAELVVPVGWRRQGCTLKTLSHKGITFYFLHNDYYFSRKGLYGFHDEAERFAFFCRAALESLPWLEPAPQILHCHDWQTGLVSVYLRHLAERHPAYRGLRTLFTIHNLRYQGIFPREVLEDIVGLPGREFTPEGLEFYGQVNFLKGGLNYADLLTTVSPSYAAEILTPAFGENLDGALRARQADLVGVINGIDYEEYNPRRDPALFVNYRHSLAKKTRNKEALQESLGLPVRGGVPLLAVISRLVREKVDILARALPGLLSRDLQLVVLGTGDEYYSGFFRHFANLHQDKMATCLGFDEGLARKIYGASDLFLMPSLFEPCGLSQLIAMRYGSIPVVRETGGLKDTVTPFNPGTGEGNGFSFPGYDSGDFLKAVETALSLYRQRDAWAGLVQNAVRADFSWSKSAGAYISLYRELLAKKRGKSD
jgi:starch synthase